MNKLTKIALIAAGVTAAAAAVWAFTPGPVDDDLFLEDEGVTPDEGILVDDYPAPGIGERW